MTFSDSDDDDSIQQRQQPRAAAKSRRRRLVIEDSSSSSDDDDTAFHDAQSTADDNAVDSFTNDFQSKVNLSSSESEVEEKNEQSDCDGGSSSNDDTSHDEEQHQSGWKDEDSASKDENASIAVSESAADFKQQDDDDDDASVGLLSSGDEDEDFAVNNNKAQDDDDDADSLVDEFQKKVQLSLSLGDHSDSSVGGEDASVDAATESDESDRKVSRKEGPKSKARPVDTSVALLSSSEDEDDDFAAYPAYQSSSPKKAAARSNIDDSISLLSSDDEEEEEKETKKTLPKYKTTGLDEDDDSDDSEIEAFDGFSTIASPTVTKVRTPTPTKSDEETMCSAWELDSHKDEYFLSSTKHLPPGIDSWPPFRIPSKLFHKLYPHQKEGVQWMAELHSKKIGGILGDDMGMGKTYQLLTHVGGLMRAGTIRNALVVAPLSVLRSWEKEANTILKNCCLPRVTIIVLTSDKPKPRRKQLILSALNCNSKSPYLIITTYGQIGSDASAFVSKYEPWDYVVLDEGHKVKNPSTNFSKGCAAICDNPKTYRLMLTGTPIQNDLKELWTLVNWSTSGQLLGTLASFRSRYGDPIERGRDKHATNRTLELAERANLNLQKALRPHFLQRLKASILSDLPEKCELVVWTHLSDKQRELYESYVKSGDTVRSIITGEKKSPLEALAWLKKLCGHPELVATPEEDSDSEDHIPSSSDLLGDSAKLQVLVSLMNKLKKAGHRPLIFSQSTRMLDIIGEVLRGFKFLRIDGSVPERRRQEFVEQFNAEGSRIDAMLLSTKAASLGLTLVGADRAIIYDPSWNPAEDCQAVDRCYRIGQMKDVTVYRFIAAGTVEEKMYEKQVYKDGLRRAVLTTSGSATERHFSPAELRQLFKLAPIGQCDFLIKFRETHPDPPTGSKGKPTLLENDEAVVGVSSHDVVYTAAPEESEIGSPGPFGGTPAKRIGRSQRAMMSDTEKKQLEEVLSSKENSPERANKKKATKTLDTAEAVLARAKELHEAGKTHFALNLVVDAIESNKLVGQDKLAMHQLAAELLNELGWLGDDEEGSQE